MFCLDTWISKVPKTSRKGDRLCQLVCQQFKGLTCTIRACRQPCMLELTGAVLGRHVLGTLVQAKRVEGLRTIKTQGTCDNSLPPAT